MLEDIYNPDPFIAYPSFPLPHPSSMSGMLRHLVQVAAAGPCSKSKRAALLIYDNGLAFASNLPAGGRACTGSEACRAACSQICNHAEELAVLKAMRARTRPGPMRKVHVLHVAVDERGCPRGDKIKPSCITCSRLMLAAGVEVVWLWGLTGARHEWSAWPIADFHAATLTNCGLPDAASEVRP